MYWKACLQHIGLNLRRRILKGRVDPKMIISQEHIWTLQNKVASLKNLQKLFYLWEGSFCLFDLQTVCLSIFRLLPSGFWPLPVCRIDWKRQAYVMGTLSLVNQYCQPMRVVPPQGLSLSVYSADWEQWKSGRQQSEDWEATVWRSERKKPPSHK